ncbi:MAG: M28 family peptidase [Bacteroidales bacterium]|nr:M28 family peptidase [Bacteroidales bacterium]
MPISARPAKIILILCLLLCSHVAASAPAKEGLAALESALRRDVEFFSDSLCAGRKTGSPGNTDAAFYIIRRLRSLGYEVQLNTFTTAGGAVGRNLIAFPEGCKNATLVMACYDGLGKMGERLYPGADSNASGVAALLALAERFKGRSDVIFACVDGHNANLAGAQELKAFLSKHRIRKVVSLDILGSTLAPPDQFWKNYLIVLGGSPYQRSLEKANYGLALHLYYNYYGSRSFTDLFYRKVSDHKFFLDRGIPVLMFTSGITMNTNREGDTSETLDYPIFAQRVALIAEWLDIQR